MKPTSRMPSSPSSFVSAHPAMPPYAMVPAIFGDRHMKRREFLTLSGGATLAWPLAGRAQQPEKPSPIDRIDDLAGAYRDAADRGAAKLLSLISPTGKFVYSYDAKTGKVSPEYNLLRHAGSPWSLLCLKTDLTRAARLTVMNSFRWLRERTRTTGKE